MTVQYNIAMEYLKAHRLTQRFGLSAFVVQALLQVVGYGSELCSQSRCLYTIYIVSITPRINQVCLLGEGNRQFWLECQVKFFRRQPWWRQVVKKAILSVSGVFDLLGEGNKF